MNVFIEWLPLLSGVVVGLLMARQTNRRVGIGLWLGLSLLLGLLVNRLSGESFAWVVVDIGLVAVSALVVSVLHRMLPVR